MNPPNPPNPPNPYQPGVAPIQTADKANDWRWRYSRWVGVMYGPIPVGVIVVAVGYTIYYLSQ